MRKCDSSYSSGDGFSDFCCFEKGPRLISSQLFTSVLSLDTESAQCDASLTCVPICASTCTAIFILPLIKNGGGGGGTHDSVLG
jgi:hypothetical protein